MAVVTVAEESSKNGKRILLAVGVAGLLIAGVLAALAISGSSSASAGADTPEDAYQQLFDSLANEDLVGAAEIMLPGERETLIQPFFDMVAEMQRLEILDPAFELSSVPGIDFEFENLEFETTPITEDLVSVRLLGGTSLTAIEPTALPLGRLVLDRLPDGTIPDDATRDLESIDPSEDGLVAVRRDGKWFVSMWYSVAEAARRDAGLPLPDPARALVARGESSAEDAVEEMVRSMIDLDVRRMLELLPPSEAEALHAYAPLFLDDAESLAREGRSAMRDFGIEIDLIRLDLSSVARGDDRIVQIGGGELLVTSDVADASLDVTDGILTAELVLHDDEVRFTLIVTGECADIEIKDFSGEVLESLNECAGEIDQLINDFFGGEMLTGELPDFDIFSERPTLGINTTEENGEWFVSPLGTMLESQVDVMAAIDQQKLEDLIDWFIEQAEGDGVGQLIGA